jgi:large subunit ribosomal protein L9
MIQLILLERVEKLGQMGDVVTVRPGYARNFLIPQKKAMRATQANIEAFKTRKVQLDADNLKLKSEAQTVAEKLKDFSVIMVRQSGEAGQLYGSVNARDIAEAIRNKGISIFRTQVIVLEPIKYLGLHAAKVVLHPEISVIITVNVAKTVEEAELQAQKAKNAKALASKTAESKPVIDQEGEAETQNTDA